MDIVNLRNSLAYLSEQSVERGEILQALHYLNQVSPDIEEDLASLEILVDEGLVYGLVLVLHNYREDEEILVVATHLLYVVGSLEKFMLSMVEYDAPGRIIFTMSQHMNLVDMLKDGVALLGNMATNDHIKALIRMQQGIALLIDILKNYSDNVQLSTSCAYALAVLCVQSSENVVEIVTGGGISMLLKPLVKHAEDNDEESIKFLEMGISLLLNVSSNDQARLEMYNHEGTSLLSSLLHNSAVFKSEYLIHLVLQTIANVALNVQVSDHIVQKTAVIQGVMSVVAAKSNDPEVLKLAVSVLCNIAAVSLSEKLTRVIASGIIDHLAKISHVQPDDKQLQIAVLECISNMIGHADTLPFSEKHQLATSSLPVLLSILQTCLQMLNEQTLEVVLRILCRLSADEKFGRELAQSKIIHSMTAILKRHYPPVAQASLNSELVRGFFNALADVSNEETAPTFVSAGVLHLCQSFSQSIINSSQSGGGRVTISAGAEKLYLAIMRLVVNLATASSGSKELAEIMLPEILSALSDKSGIARNQSFLNLVSSFFINIGLQAKACSVLLARKVPEAILELCQDYSSNPDLVARLILGLNNMAITGKAKFKAVLNALDVPNRVRATNHTVLKAITQYSNSLIAPDDAERAALLAKKRQEDEINIRKIFATGDAEAKLIARFNIPVIDQELRTFVNAGKFMIKYNSWEKPHTRYVFVSPDMRFLVWRDPVGSNLKSIYLLTCKQVLIGNASPELQRSLVPEGTAFVVEGALRSASFSCDSQDERDRWVQSLRAVIEYNVKVNIMEGKSQENKAKEQEDDDEEDTLF